MTPTPARLGRYVLVSEVARGAFGRLATACTRLASGEARAVLLRRLVKGPPLDAAALEQLAHAAGLCLSAYGQHVAAAIAVEDGDEELGVAFDYLAGKDLRSLLALASIKHQRIPASVALHIAASALEGLVELRADFPEELRTAAVWPDSVFVAVDGSVRLLDAPLAAAIARAPGPRELRQLIGYSAPEELEDRAELAQSDVFRVGVLLWEMLSGKRLFSGGTTSNSIQQVRQAPIPPLGELATEHAPLADVVMRALERDRSARHAGTDELHAALVECGVPRASDDEVAAYLGELLGAGLAIQQRAVENAMEALPPAEAPSGELAAPLVLPAGASSTTTLLGVPAPALLPARPARPRTPPPPPSRPARAPAGSSPLILPAVDDLESPLASEPEPERPSLESLTDVELLEELEDDAAAPPPPPFAPAPAPEPDSSVPKAAPRKLAHERKYVVAGAAALAILLVGVGVLALVGSVASSPQEPAAMASVAGVVPAAVPPAATPTTAKSVAKIEAPPSPAADEPAVAEPKPPPQPKRSALAAKKKPMSAAEKKKAAIAAAKRAQAERIAKINKANKARAAAAKKKQAAAAKKKKQAAAAKKKKQAAAAKKKKKQAAKQKAAKQKKTASAKR